MRHVPQIWLIDRRSVPTGTCVLFNRHHKRLCGDATHTTCPFCRQLVARNFGSGGGCKLLVTFQFLRSISLQIFLLAVHCMPLGRAPLVPCKSHMRVRRITAAKMSNVESVPPMFLSCLQCHVAMGCDSHMHQYCFPGGLCNKSCNPSNAVKHKISPLSSIHPFHFVRPFSVLQRIKNFYPSFHPSLRFHSLLCSLFGKAPYCIFPLYKLLSSCCSAALPTGFLS